MNQRDPRRTFHLKYLCSIKLTGCSLANSYFPFLAKLQSVSAADLKVLMTKVSMSVYVTNHTY